MSIVTSGDAVSKGVCIGSAIIINKDNIEKSVKKARLSAIQSLLNEQQKNYNKTFLNKNMEVLLVLG